MSRGKVKKSTENQIFQLMINGDSRDLEQSYMYFFLNLVATTLVLWIQVLLLVDHPENESQAAFVSTPVLCSKM